MEKRYLKKTLWNYILKMSSFSLALLIMFSFLFWQYTDPEALNFISRRKNLVRIVAYVIIFIPYFFARFYRLFKLFLDIVTGCKTKDIEIYVETYFEQPLEKVLSEFKYIDRYYESKFRTVDGKKGRLLQDKKLCDFELVRGNIHTVRVLYYSNFLIKAKHGKKELD